MALGFRSSRVTADVDFTSNADPEDLPERLKEELNRGLQQAQASLGYLDLMCQVQKIKKRPRPINFSDQDFPALEVGIAYTIRGSKGEKRFHEGHGTDVVKVEISFKEQVYAFQELHLSKAGVAIYAYSVTEVIAEKLRALLQQPKLRDKSRRQDIYDISYLTDGQDFNDDERKLIFQTFIDKCKTRDIYPTPDSFDHPKIKELAFKEWHTLKDEVEELPDFEERFTVVSKFYKNLPWS